MFCNYWSFGYIFVDKYINCKTKVFGFDFDLFEDLLDWCYLLFFFLNNFMFIYVNIVFFDSSFF